jgi:polyferredoxin
VAAYVGVSPWLSWVGETFLLATFYFRLLERFDEGVVFWTLILLGLLVVWF